MAWTLSVIMNELKRCTWPGIEHPLYTAYHDDEWGVPVYDDKTLFEFLVLEGAQAGLSWLTILKKRDGYRKAFHDFDVQKVADMSDKDLENLKNNPEIIRNILKITSARKNARIFIEIQQEFGSFSNYLWGFVENNPIINKFKNMSDVPAATDISEKLSKDLKKRGMSFVGPTIMYAYMQSMGLVNDHLASCHRYEACCN